MHINGLQIYQFHLPQSWHKVSLQEAQPRRLSGIDVIAVEIFTDSGACGLGFTWSNHGISAIRSLIENDFPGLLLHEDPLQNERLFSNAMACFRKSGWQGLVARSWAAIDIALWDIKGKAANLPLYHLFGGHRHSAPYYLSEPTDLFLEPSEIISRVRPQVTDGAMGVLIEIGSGDVQQDADRVQNIRDALGEDAWIAIDARCRLDLATALALSHFFEDDVGVDRCEELLPVDDSGGYHKLAQRLEIPLALGSTLSNRGDFRTILERGDIRVLRPDLLRLGGITPFLKIAALAESYSATIAPYQLPELSVHLACGLTNVDAVENTAMLSCLFQDRPNTLKGSIFPSKIAGHGLLLSPDAVEKYSFPFANSRSIQLSDANQFGMSMLH